MRLPYLHEGYRAFTIGLQAGVVGVATLWLLRFTGLFACESACSCSTFLWMSALGALLALHVGTWRLPAAERAVLVTGCDSGFGLALALRLQELGCVVFAGCLQAAHGDGAQQLRRLPRVHVLQLDVTNEEQIKAASSYVEEHLPVNGLWGVVNNAGIYLFGPAEITRPEDAIRVFQVNTLGIMRVSRAFLPLLRRTKGRLVNVVSVVGRMYCGPHTPYTMSKYASEGLSDCLRFEQRQFGVHVAIITPGNFGAATRILEATDQMKLALHAAWNDLSDEARATYGEDYPDLIFNGSTTALEQSEASTKDVSPVTAAMEHALFGCWPAPRYHVMKFGLLLRTVLYTHGPEWLYEKLNI